LQIHGDKCTDLKNLALLFAHQCVVLKIHLQEFVPLERGVRHSHGDYSCLVAQKTVGPFTVVAKQFQKPQFFQICEKLLDFQNFHFIGKTCV